MQKVLLLCICAILELFWFPVSQIYPESSTVVKRRYTTIVASSTRGGFPMKKAASLTIRRKGRESIGTLHEIKRNRSRNSLEVQ